MKQIYQSLFLAIVMTTLSVGVFGTPPSNPQFMNNGDEFYMKGHNSTNASASTTLPSEMIDSVTVGSVMTYFVWPNETVNTLWHTSTGGRTFEVYNTSDLMSEFEWSVSALGVKDGTTNVSGQHKSHILNVKWNSTGSSQVTIKEIPDPSLGCAGTPTTIDVRVISAPTFKFTTTTGMLCNGGSYAFSNQSGNAVYASTTAVSGAARLRGSFTVTSPSGQTTTYSDKPFSELDAIVFDEVGNWTITVTQVTDRISRKYNTRSSSPSGSITGYPLTGTVTAGTFTLTVLPPINSGPVFRIPNMY